MSLIKKAGFAMQWLWLAVLSYAFGLTVYALQISKGLAGFNWSFWRVALAITVIWLVSMAMHLSDSKRDLSVGAVLATVIPWVALACVWLMKLYFDWTFSWPPAEWILIAFLGVYSFPLLCGVAYLAKVCL
ncbi:hypothetical protein [Kosakonia cowanii]|uniref:hypothetical protein n=1 Tax=Kosakonia cowanii TaxID=208223 RepID=UPI001F569C8F|nr:hypothetical protein [Kosakonia cowanii]MDT3409661.1 hypothetical protein [Atlantibacter sp. SORGH_AS_0304]